MTLLICEIQHVIQINLFTKQKQTHRHRKQIYGFQRRKWGDKSGVWTWQMQATVYKINKILLL